MSSYKSIMVTGTITGARQDAVKVYDIIVEEGKKHSESIYSPIDTMEFKGTDEEMYARVMELLKTTDLVVAEMRQASTGQGMELQEAVRLDIPIVIVAEVGSKISSTVLGSGKVKKTIFYNDLQNLREKVSEVFELI
ncbi:MAG: hypothetical protein FWC79_07035 [Oscillospiraceae bacterium]|nr:hypothetical protein [Oscillospiraceae bacterium]